MIAFRIMGMIFTIAASAALGFYLSNLGKFRLQDLQEIKKALLILRSEIEYVATPLPEAMANIGKRTSLPVSKIFNHFAENLRSNDSGDSAYHLWLAAIDAHKKETFLKDEDWEVVENFGKTLGYLDKQMQIETIKLTTDYINSQAAGLQEDNSKNQRMYRSLGLIGGVLLLVIFW